MGTAQLAFVEEHVRSSDGPDMTSPEVPPTEITSPEVTGNDVTGTGIEREIISRPLYPVFTAFFPEFL